VPQVDVNATAELIKVFIDGTRVTLSGANTGSRNVAAGEHAISWNVRGAPGSSYTVQITAPSAVAFRKDAKLDDTQMDAGLHFFKV
jgi:hypothetical protein